MLNKACHFGTTRFSQLGVKPSKETVEKRSAQLRGKPGKIPSHKTRLKMSIAQRLCKQTPEFRAKMSKIRTGTTLSSEIRAKISKSNSGRVLGDSSGRTWINNGITSKLVHLDHLDDGWVVGRLMSRVWITDGIDSKMIGVSESIPQGWLRGRSMTAETCLKMSQSAVNRQRLSPTTGIPPSQV